MLTTLKRWTRPLTDDVEDWVARFRGDNPLSTYDRAIRRRRRRLPELEAMVASIVTLRDATARDQGASPNSTEVLAQLDANLAEAEQGLTDYRAELDRLVAQRSALAEELARSPDP